MNNRLYHEVTRIKHLYESTLFNFVGVIEKLVCILSMVYLTGSKKRDGLSENEGDKKIFKCIG